MSRRKTRRPAATPDPPAIQLDAAGLLVLLIALLLPFVAAGVPLDEVATPGTDAGRWLLALLATIVLYLRPAAASEARWWRQPLAWLATLGLLSLLVPRGGPAVPPIDVPGVGAATAPLHLRLPADFAAGLSEFLRLCLLLAIANAAGRVPGRYVLAGLGLGLGLLLVRGLREYLPELRQGAGAWRVFGGFTNPNLLAGYLVVTIPALAAAIALAGDDSRAGRWLAAQHVARPGLKLRVCGGALLLGLLLLLGLTGSRGGVLAAGCGAVAGCVGVYRSGWRKGAAWLLAGAVLGAVVLAAGPLRSRLMMLALQQHSAGFRELTWLGTWDLAQRVPWLGVGLGGWMTTYPVFSRAAFTQHAHQGYLQVLAEGGVVALLAKLAFLVYLLRSGWRLCRLPSPKARATGPALLAATAAFMLHNAIDFDWYVPAIPAALALLAAVANRMIQPGEPAGDRGKAWLAGLLLVLVASPLAIAERHRATAQAQLREALPGSAKESVDAALAWAPWSALLYEEQAGVRAAMGQSHAAEAAYRAALERRPNTARLWYRLAALQAADGQVESALNASATAVRLSPMHLQGWLQLGKLLSQAGRPEAARAAFRQLDDRANLPALALQDPLKGYTFEPTHGYALMRLADLALAAGDRDEARDAYDRARPDFESYLKTYRGEEQTMAPLDPETRDALLRMRGLTAEERAEIESLLARANAMVAELEAP